MYCVDVLIRMNTRKNLTKNIAQLLEVFFSLHTNPLECFVKKKIVQILIYT